MMLGATKELGVEYAHTRPIRVTPVPRADTLEIPSLTASRASQRPLERGSTIGRFRIVDRLGQGGMGVVLAAYDPNLDRKIALKVVRTDGVGPSAETATRLMREARATAKLAHENVVVIHDVDHADDHVFVAMELLDGGTLRDWTSRSDLGWREVLDVYMRAGAGLAAAHRAGLVHRDFKPDNVLIGVDGRVRVTDFGLVSHVDAADGARLTRPGTTVGTPGYMPPEQYDGRAVGVRADQFAFCVSLFEALYGVKPFAGVTRRELLLDMLCNRVVATDNPRGVPVWVRDVLRRGLRADPRERHESMDALLAALGTHRRRRLAGIAIAVGVVAAATAAAIALVG